jgi:hypothetical protein
MQTNKTFDTDKIAVLLYSIEQKCFHIESMSEYVANQLEHITNNSNLDFQLIGVFESEIEANDWTIEHFDWHEKKFTKFTLDSLINKM